MSRHTDLSFLATALSSIAANAARAAGVVTLAAALSSSAAMATEGYVQNGIGARNKALAGAGVAHSTDSTAVSLNPAGLTNVDSQVSGSLSAMHLDGGYNSHGFGLTADGSHKNDYDWVPIPNIAANWRVNWGIVDAVGFSVYGHGAVVTRYGNFDNPNCPIGSGVMCGGKLGINEQQSIASIAFAKQIAPGLSVGIAPLLARQALKVEGMGLFAGFSSDPANFTNRGQSDSWGAGVRGGLEWKATPWLRLGLAANSVVRMSTLDKYTGLLAEHGRGDFPATVQAGMAIDMRPDLTLMVDYKRIWFGAHAAVANFSDTLLTEGALYGSDRGPGFGLRDVDVIKVGLEGKYSPSLTWRLGYSYNTAPLVPRDVNINITTLGVVQHHITGGVKYAVSDRLDLELSTMYAPRASISGTELGNPARAIEIHNSEFEITFGAVYHFGDRDTRSTPLK